MEMLVTEREAAKRLSVSTKTLSRVRKRGEIEFVRPSVGKRSIRYTLKALADWIERIGTSAAAT